MRTIEVKTKAKEELIDLTHLIKEEIASSQIKNGFCLIFVPHTTAGITINEHADPSVKADFLMALRELIPDSLAFEHSEGNSPAHIKASLVGSSVHLIIEDGQPYLGTWQGIFFCEFDGPRRRKVSIHFLT